TRKRRAISPIIATLLLILIAIAAGVVVYAYVIGFIGNSTSNSGSTIDTLSIDQAVVSSKTTSFPVTVFVRNQGPSTENFNTGFFVKGSALDVQLAPAVTLTLASGSISVTNVALTGSGSNVLTVKLTCSGTGTATVAGFGTSATSSACSGSAVASLTLGAGVVVASSLATANTPFASFALSSTPTVVGVSITAGTISLPINAVIPLTLAQPGQQVASGAGTGQSNEPLAAGQTYTVQVTGTDGATTTVSAKAS
ncbi:MAG: hypothetical protein JRN52_00005, partial [Nitrososphaerota archaeon]|nr:hypothetical protein [Nitrososphaerota archaeon]